MRDAALRLLTLVPTGAAFVLLVWLHDNPPPGDSLVRPLALALLASLSLLVLFATGSL